MWERINICNNLKCVWGRMDRVAHIIGAKLRNKTKEQKKRNKMQNEMDNLGCLLVALTIMPSARQSPVMSQKTRVSPSSAGFNIAPRPGGPFRHPSRDAAGAEDRKLTCLLKTSLKTRVWKFLFQNFNIHFQKSFLVWKPSLIKNPLT